MIVLIDTNILLDVLQERHPHFDHSSRVWNLTEENVVTGYVSAISFNNVFYVLRKQVGADVAREGVKAIRRVFKSVALDDAVLDRAIASPASDFEDAIQAAAAALIDADYIVTRNVNDFHTLGTTAVTPEELLAILAPK